MSSRSERNPLRLLWAFAALVGLVAACVALGLLATELSGITRSAMAFASLLLAIGFLYAGRSDLSRPEFLLPAIWYSAVTLAQTHLLAGYQTPWSAHMVLTAFFAPLVFAAGSLVGGGGATRPTSRMPLAGLSAGRLRAAGAFLLLVGFAGLALKAQRTGGVALFADEIDSLRSAGGIKIPAWLTMMTDCLFLSTWTFLIAGGSRSRGAARVMDFSLAAVGLAGVAFGASRNTLLITLLVPAIFAYLAGAARGISRRGLIWSLVLVTSVTLVASGLFYVRTGQHKQGSFETAFYSYVVPKTPVVLRPLLPLYIGLTAPLETLNRTTIHSDSAISGVSYFFPGIPPRITPFGPRGDFYAFTAAASRPYYFNVATFVGAAYLDGAVPMALLIALIMGLAFGVARRFLLRSPTPASLAIVAYLTYLVAFLIYENLFTFYTLSVVFDLIVIWSVLNFGSVRQTSAKPTTHLSRIDPDLAIQ
jgi:oligosaccharide repeat unit polymerase